MKDLFVSRGVIVRCIVIALLMAGMSLATAEPISRIPAGTIVRDSSAAEWNRVILRAVPRIATGDVDSLGKSVRKLVERLHLTIMATVHEDEENGRFRLADVGVGYSTVIQGKPTIVDSETASDLGAELGFFGRQLLSTNEQQLRKVRVVVRSTTLTLFDTPAIFHRNDHHESFFARHLVWIDTASGRLVMANWLLVQDELGNLMPTMDPIRIVAGGTREDRRIHVDGDAFNFLGVPSETAFAVEDLPPGRDLVWTSELEACLADRSYDANGLGRMATTINQAVGDAR